MFSSQRPPSNCSSSGGRIHFETSPTSPLQESSFHHLEIDVNREGAQRSVLAFWFRKATSWWNPKRMCCYHYNSSNSSRPARKRNSFPGTSRCDCLKARTAPCSNIGPKRGINDRAILLLWCWRNRLNERMNGLTVLSKMVLSQRSLWRLADSPTIPARFATSICYCRLSLHDHCFTLFRRKSCHADVA